MRHQPRDAAVAVKKRVNPRQTVMGRRRGGNGFGLAEAAIDLLESCQEARHRRRTDGDTSRGTARDFDKSLPLLDVEEQLPPAFSIPVLPEPCRHFFTSAIQSFARVFRPKSVP